LPAALAPDWPPDYAERFWQLYPHKIARKKALALLQRLGQSGAVPFDELMAGLHRYAAKDDDRPFCNPTTWINGERWTDQPAPNGGYHGKVNHGTLPQQAERLADLVRARERAEGIVGSSDLFGSDDAGGPDVEIIPPERR
jgi:hypothetical protein